MADPARTQKTTLRERRRRAQAICREEPCLPVLFLLTGRPPLADPPCVFCVHERKIDP